jgi:acyl-CoA synthetase (AMP-forming)/AMP-acid ligase II/acyl carrier protein
MVTPLRSFVDVLQDHAARFPERVAYTYLRDGESDSSSLTYGALHATALGIAGALAQRRRASNERALLIYPSGLEFIAGFFGALCAGLIPVPVYPPRTARSDRTLPRLHGIIRDCRPDHVLTCEALRSTAESICAATPELHAATLLITDRAQDAARGSPVSPSDADIAFLQYTSGSTGAPKGVAVGHGALFANARMIVDVSQLAAGEVGVSWLPLYHDMGLIGGVLSTCLAGATLVLLSPLRFLQSPIRWLSAISRYRAIGSTAPNFAYELCVEKVTPEQRSGLDLSSWRVAFNGAEPIRASTIERFTTAFAPHGFRREAFTPCYGLAEATLLVSAKPLGQVPRIDRFSRTSLARNAVGAPRDADDAAELVACGVVENGLEAAIVDPGSGRELGPSEVGEIWIAGTSIASGYWSSPEGAETGFGAKLASRPGRSFLRTGDLGFLSGADLFVTGRIKDLIIVRGRNLHPQDLELCAEQAHPAFRPGSGVAFSVPGEDGEEVVLVYPERGRHRESDRPEVADLAAVARAAIASEHLVDLLAVVLVPASSIPKTSSGKLQRSAARQMYLDGSFAIVEAWRRGATETPPAAEPLLTELRALNSERERVAHLATRIRAEIARVLGTTVADVDPSWPLVDLGLDSLKLIEVRQRFQALFGVELSTNVLFGFPTVDALAPRLLEAAGLGFEAPRRASMSIGDDLLAAAGPVASDDGLSDEDLQRRLVEGP